MQLKTVNIIQYEIGWINVEAERAIVHAKKLVFSRHERPPYTE